MPGRVLPKQWLFRARIGRPIRQVGRAVYQNMQFNALH